MSVARAVAAFPHISHWKHLANPYGNCSIFTSCSRGPGIRTKFPRVKKSQAKAMASWFGASCISHILLVSQTLGLRVTPKTEPTSCTPLDTECQDRVTVCRLLSQGLRSQCRCSRVHSVGSAYEQREPKGPSLGESEQEVWPTDYAKGKASVSLTLEPRYICALGSPTLIPSCLNLGS